MIDVERRRLDVELPDDELARAPRGVDGAGAALHDRRAREVRGARRLGVGGRDDRIARVM